MDLPLPIAALLRRARNAKSPKERHDTAYFAWEASLRLAVAARPPADATPLALPSTGHWVGAFVGSDALLDQPALLAALALLSEVGLGKKAAPRAVTAKTLLEPLAAYRNQVIGHGSTRAADFYERAGDALLEGLEAAWSAGVFWPVDARLVFLESIEIDRAGGRQARTLALSGLAAVLEGASGGGGRAGGAAGAPGGALPRRLYLRTGGQLRPLHPWLVYQESELRERVLFFNGRGRTAQLLDYVSGEGLKGKALAEAFPALEADLDALFSRGPAGGAQDRRGEAPVLRQAQDERGEADDPSRFGDYRLLGKLGQGGMGVVYLARQEGLGRIVALKMLPLDAAQDPVAVARFKREVAALSRCDHPNVVKIHASGVAQGTHYYAMELVEGADLSQVALALSETGGDFDGAVSSASERVRRAKSDAFAHIPDVRAAGELASAPAQIAARAKDRPRRLAALFRDAARGVHHIHEVGVIHRDLKPGNLMVTAIDHRVVVMDLGLAALGDASRSITKDRSALLGTLRYMAPEQLQRNLVTLDRRADVYSLGATLYELVTDRKLFDGDSEARLIEQVLRETPVPAEKAGRSVPRDLSVIIGKATEKDPARRYETAAALAADLASFVEGRPIAARAPTLRYVLRLAIARHRALAATVAAAIVLAVAGTAFFVAREGRLRREAEEQRADAVQQRSEAVQQRAEAVQQRAEAVRLSGVALEREKEAQAERARAEQREREANSNLAAVFMEKTDRALAGADVLAAQVLAARALSLADGPEARGILFETRSSVRMLWATPRRPPTIAEALAYSPDGRLLAVGGPDGVVRLWDPSTGRAVRSLPGHEGGAAGLDFSPDGARLASGGADRTVRVWDVATGALLHELRGHEGAVFTVAFGAAGRIASGGADGAIVLWDAEKGARVHTLRYHKDVVWSVALSRDGRLLASGGRDRKIGIVDLEDVRRRGSPPASPHATLGAGADASVAFSPDGRRLAFGGKDGGTHVYDLEEKAGQPVLSLAGQASSLGLAFSPDGRRLACAGGGSVRIIEIDGGKEVHSRQVSLTGMTVSPDGRRMAIGDADQTVRILDVDARKEVALLRPEAAGCTALAFSADGRTVAAGGRDRAIRLLDAATGQETRVLRGHQSWVTSVAFDARGRRLASCAETEVLTWDPSSGEPRASAASSVTRHAIVALSPEGRRLAAARASEGGIDLIDIDADRDPRGAGLTLLGDDDRDEKDRATCLAFSDDGAALLAGYEDGMLRRWDVSTRKRVFKAQSHRRYKQVMYDDEPVLGVACGRDGRRIFSGSENLVGHHDLVSGQGIYYTRELEGVTALAFAPDGRFAIGMGTGTVYMGSLFAERLVAAARGHGAAVRSLAWSRDGHRLASGADDHSVRLWSVEEGREAVPCGGKLVGAAVLPDGRLIVGRGDGATQLVDLVTGVLEAPTGTSKSGAQQGVVSLALSPDGRRTATAAKDRTVSVCEVGTGRPIATYRAHEHEVTCAAFSPDGRWLASGGLDRWVVLHDLREIARPAPLDGEPGTPPLQPGAAVACLAWSRGSDRLISGGADGRIKVFDVATRREVQALRAHEGPVGAIAITPDGARIVSAGADGTVRLWDLAGGKEIGVLASATKGVRCIAFSPSGAWLVLGGSDGVARVLDLALRRELLAVRRLGGGANAPAGGNPVVAIGFTPDGGRLVVTSEDGTARILEVAGLERFLRATPDLLLSEAEGDTGIRIEGIDLRVIPDNRVVRK